VLLLVYWSTGVVADVCVFVPFPMLWIKNSNCRRTGKLANVDFLTVTSRCSKCLWSGRIVCPSCCRTSYFPNETTTATWPTATWLTTTSAIAIAVRVVVKALKRFSPDLTQRQRQRQKVIKGKNPTAN